MAHNSLTPRQEIVLVMLLEEAAEVIKCASKVLRFGYDDYHPDDQNKRSNRTLLGEELTDFAVMYSLLIESGDAEPANIHTFLTVEDKKQHYIEWHLSGGN